MRLNWKTILRHAFPFSVQAKRCNNEKYNNIIDRRLYVFVVFQFGVNILHDKLTTLLFNALKDFVVRTKRTAERYPVFIQNIAAVVIDRADTSY
jgi:hypothetical protein